MLTRFHPPVSAVDPTRARLFHQTKEAQEGGLFAIFQRTLQDRQWPVQEKAGKVAAHLAARAPGDGSKDAVAMADGVLGWMKGMLSEDFPGEEGEERAAAALQVLDALAINRSMRGKAMEAGIPELLGPLLAPERVAEMSPQRQYEATLALWLLSFEEGALGRFKEGGLLQGLLALLKGAPKEKVVRAGLMALANLLDRANGRNDAWVELAEHGLPRLVTALRARSFADEELNDALERVAKKSESSVKEATSLDKFKREVESGSLDWTRVHTDDSFWRAHVHDLEEDDWGPVRGLLQLLTSSSSSSKTLQVAAHDLGCFAQYHPRGRNVLTDIGAKDAVVKIMAHTDPEVRKHALLASQKILVSRWEFLSGYGA